MVMKNDTEQNKKGAKRKVIAVNCGMLPDENCISPRVRKMAHIIMQWFQESVQESVQMVIWVGDSLNVFFTPPCLASSLGQL
jgi:hypothetical protein